MTDVLSLRLGDVLYRTRGRDWDYCFVLQPKPLLREGWYGLHRRIFANIEPAPQPVLLRGALGVATGEPFFATTFTDPVRRDSQGRAVAHYLTWLGSDAERAPGRSFGEPFVDAVSPALQAIFDLSPKELDLDAEAPLDALLRAHFDRAQREKLLSLSCPQSAPLRWLGTVPV